MRQAGNSNVAAYGEVFRPNFNMLCEERAMSRFDHLSQQLPGCEKYSLTPVARRAASGAVYSEGGAASTNRI